MAPECIGRMLGCYGKWCKQEADRPHVADTSRTKLILVLLAICRDPYCGGDIVPTQCLLLLTYRLSFWESNYFSSSVGIFVKRSKIYAAGTRQ